MSSGSIRDGGRPRRSAPAARPAPAALPAPAVAGPSRTGLLLAAIGLAGLGLLAATGIAQALAPASPASPFDGPLADCRVGDRLTPHRGPGDWSRTLLDQEYALAADDVPPDLVSLADRGIDGPGALRSFVLDDLSAMLEDARDADAAFRVTSTYRSHQHQVRTFASLEAEYGLDEALRSAARPGHSEHQLGTTIDVEGGEAWLAANARRYGFVMSYPAEHSPRTTCYKPEPWHFRYVGRDAARAVDRSGLSLRAWLWQRQADD